MFDFYKIDMFGVFQKIIPPAPVAHVEITEHDQSVLPAQLDLGSFVIEGLKRSCDWILHQGLSLNYSCFIIVSACSRNQDEPKSLGDQESPVLKYRNT